jgi:hypothetical protein
MAENKIIEEALNDKRFKQLPDEIKGYIEQDGVRVEVYREISKFTDGVERLGNGMTIVINVDQGPGLLRIVKMLQSRGESDK